MQNIDTLFFMGFGIIAQVQRKVAATNETGSKTG